MFKNIEFKRFSLLILGLTIALIVIGIVLGLPAFGVLLIGINSLVYYFLFMMFEKSKYKRISDLSDMLDRILHGDDSISIKQCEEGEIAILSSEIQKMTIRLKEQSDALLKDKREMGDAIYDISHQLRTPLTSMNLVVELLGKESLDFDSRIRLIRELKTSLSRIDWLIESLLKLSKIDAKTAKFEKNTVRINDLIKDSIEPFLVSMDLKDIEFLYEKSDASFIGDKKWSMEAIGNLFKNCLEHTPIGGKIIVSTKENTLFSEIIIKDSGDGFVEEDIPYLFDRFYKGKNASPSSIGIGLALARSVIVEQNGTIKAKNDEKSGGAMFVIRFYKSVV